jgi:ATP-dependent RNA helicase RhlE
MKHLEHIGYSVASIHGNKSQGQRERALKAFRDGDIKTLIATDVAARGIDIPAVSHVYNYDLPEVPDAYVHRIGRTARAGRDGIAIAFCAPDEARLLRDIERLMNIDITVASGEAPTSMNASPRRANGNRNGGGQGRGGEGRGEQNRTGNRQERRPRREGEGGEHRAGNEERRERRPRPERQSARNEDFRGQRRGEAAPAGPDNDLAATSDFRPARKPQRPQPHGSNANSGDANRHHPGAGARNAHGRPARKPGEDRGVQANTGGERGERREGNGGNRRGGPSRGGNGGQRRERA